jgi:hypothetical protein
MARPFKPENSKAARLNGAVRHGEEYLRKDLAQCPVPACHRLLSNENHVVRPNFHLGRDGQVHGILGIEVEGGQAAIELWVALGAQHVNLGIVAKASP